LFTLQAVFLFSGSRFIKGFSDGFPFYGHRSVSTNGIFEWWDAEKAA
jgi:hypothetical protein